MLSKLQSKKEEGFTIIEVLIVLAIAGLILLIVFLAVPALQRNSRNTQRRNDVSKMMGGLQEIVNNNNGQFPTAAAPPAAITGGLGFYAVADVNFSTNPTAPPAVPATVATTGNNSVVIRNGVRCVTPFPLVTGATATLPTAGTTTNVGATGRNSATLFVVEIDRTNFQLQCTDS